MTTTQKYPEFPTNEYTHVQRIIKELKEVLARDSKRHQMDEHLDSSLRDLIEYEIIPALEEHIDYDPTPQYLYDNTGGEPAVTASELHEAARSQHQQLHK